MTEKIPTKKVIVIIDDRPVYKLIAPDKSLIEHNAKIEWELKNKQKKSHKRSYIFHK
jgi:hypothetical protein